jgi:HTH-type transcriptional regulator / antitoxin HigA
MINFKTVHTISSEDEYEAALRAIRPYFEAEPEDGTPEAANFEALALLIGHYEERQHAIAAADPVDVLRLSMEANGRTQSDLAQLLGSRSRASEILNGRRQLTLEQIRKLAREWHIPAGALVGELEFA